MTVRECQSRVDSDEFRGWVAYYNIDPFGEERADLRMGILVSTVANMLRNKTQRPFKPEDFMPFTERQEQTQDEMWKQMAAFARAHNARLGHG